MPFSVLSSGIERRSTHLSGQRENSGFELDANKWSDMELDLCGESEQTISLVEPPGRMVGDILLVAIIFERISCSAPSSARSCGGDDD